MDSKQLDGLTRKMNVQSCMFWISEAIQKLLAEGAKECDVDEALFVLSLYGYDYKVSAEKVDIIDSHDWVSEYMSEPIAYPLELTEEDKAEGRVQFRLTDAGRELLELMVEQGNGG